MDDYHQRKLRIQETLMQQLDALESLHDEHIEEGMVSSLP